MNKTAAGKPVAKQTTSDKDGTTTRPSAQPAPSQMWVVREIADTTWRMTIPVVLFAFIGIYGDLRFGSGPWLTLLGVVIGFYFAAVLIRKQINRSKDLS